MSGLAPKSPRRRKSVGLKERSLNNLDDSNTLSFASPERIGKISDEGSSTWNPKRKPRKSCLKLNDDDDTISIATASAPSGRRSLGISRRVSFHPTMHVRWFEKEDEKKRRKSSMGAMRRSLPGAPSRRSSIQIAQPAPRVTPASPRSPRQRYFVGEGEELGEESMEMSMDEDGLDYEEEASPFGESGQPPAAPQDAGDDSYATDESEEMDMEETTVLDANIRQGDFAHDDTDYSEEDMSIEEPSNGSASDEEKTMDFTVALGGAMPNVPPQGATRSRASIGYLNPRGPDESSAEPLHPGDDTDGSSMMETAVYGTVYAEDSLSDDTTGNSDPDGRTTTFNYTAMSNMEFTTAIGGIHRAADDDGSDMELTQAIGGIHNGNASMVTGEFTTRHNDETGAMEFTSVIGGIHREVTETGMEFTTVIGGIHQSVNQTRTNIFDTSTTTRNIFAADSDYMGNTQTGIAYPVLEPAKIAEVDEEPPVPTTRTRGSSATPGRKTPTKAATPSFMRPTAASASKTSASKTKSDKPKKKNPFAPSPDSPGLQRSKSRTPQQRGESMEKAASVAKKLDFGAASSDTKSTNVFASTSVSNAGMTPKRTPRKSLTPRRATPKRPREEEEEEHTSKRRNIFAPPSSESQRIFKADAVVPEPQPAAETVEAKPAQPEEAQPEVPEPELPEEVEGEEDMELEEEMVEMDDQEAYDEAPEEDGQPDPYASPPPARPVTTSYTPIRERKRESLGGRKSLGAMGPPVRVSLLPNRSPSPDAPEPEPIGLADFLEMTGIEFMDRLRIATRRSSAGGGLLGAEDREFGLHDFVAGNLDTVYVNFYEWAIEKMLSNMASLSETLSSTEKVLDEENPVVVREYLRASEEERGLFQTILREYKTNTMLRARSNWYDWKREVMEQHIHKDVKSIRDEMVEDAERFKTRIDAASTLLPNLRSRHEALKAELAAHRAAVERIEACDQEELKELKAGVVEQNAEIERFTAELEDKNARLAELQSQAAQLEQECEDHRKATEAARAESSESSPSDVLRLDAEHRALQDLHGWKIVRASPLRMTFDDEMELNVPVVNGVPDINGASLSLVHHMQTRDGSTLGLIDLTRRALAHTRPATLPALVRAAGQLWTAARHLRDEIRILKLYYPSTYSADHNTFTAIATVMLPKQRAKVQLTFTIGHGTLAAWPSVHAVTAIRVNAEVVYGSADAAGIKSSAEEMLATVVPDVPGVLYQACSTAAGV